MAGERLAVRYAGLALAAVGMWPASALAQVQTPTFKVGDHWVYQETNERAPSSFQQSTVDVVVTRVAEKYIEIASKQPEAPAAPVERMVPNDWSRERSVNGVMTTVNKPLSFPLSPGKRWEIKYTEANPARLVHSQTIHESYTVAGWEDVQTPAGVFHALKIECEGDWAKETAPSQVAAGVIEKDATGAGGAVDSRNLPAQTTAGKLYKAFWYAPEVKRFVKSSEEYFSTTGVRSSRTTSVLQSFSPAP
jgi:hypothetical protein